MIPLLLYIYPIDSYLILDISQLHLYE